jgi:phosphate/sulfate permease
VGTNVSCLHVPKLLGIAASWVTSPIFAGIIGVTLHVGLKHLIIDQPDADQRALRACPFLVAITMTCMTALVMFKSPVTAHISWWWVATGSVGVGLCTFAGGYYLLVPHIKSRLISAQIKQRCACGHNVTHPCMHAYRVYAMQARLFRVSQIAWMQAWKVWESGFAVQRGLWYSNDFGSL